MPDIPPGVTIGRGAYIGRDVQFDYRYARLITVEDDVTIVSGSSILCHDASSFRRLGVTWVAPVRVCTGAYIGSRSVIMPGVTVGPGAVVGASSVVTRDVPAKMVAVGVPARVIGTVESLDQRRRDMLELCGSFDTDVVYRRELGPTAEAAMRRALDHHGGFFTTSEKKTPSQRSQPHNHGGQA